jgi:hypothetical protein
VGLSRFRVGLSDVFLGDEQDLVNEHNFYDDLRIIILELLKVYAFVLDWVCMGVAVVDDSPELSCYSGSIMDRIRSIVLTTGFNKARNINRTSI